MAIITGLGAPVSASRFIPRILVKAGDRLALLVNEQPEYPRYPVLGISGGWRCPNAPSV